MTDGVVAELRATLGKLEVALGAIDDAIAWTNEAGVVQWSNARFDALVGRPRLSVLGAPVAEVLPLSPGEHPARAALSSPPAVRELELAAPSGPLAVEVFAAAVRLAGAASVVLVVRDVTERRRAETELRAARARAEAALAEVEAFSYTVAHDLRAPLRHVDGFIALLRARAGPSLDEESRRHMDVIAASARRMGTMIDDLLSFSRMGRAEPARGRVALGELAARAWAELAAELEGRPVEWRVGELPEAEGDAAMLQLVFANLLGNAVKFTRGRVPAVITVGSRREPGRHVVWVKDNGVGFDPRYAGKLFGVFSRLHRPEEFEGTGIGLASVRRVIARHGGETWAEGQPGEGATFYFSLPI